MATIDTEATEAAYREVAVAISDVTPYMEYALNTARWDRLERLIVFAPTPHEMRELTTAFASEGSIPDDDVYRSKLSSRWLRAELNIDFGKPKWLAAIGMEPNQVVFRLVAGPLDHDALSRAMRGEAPPEVESFSARLLRVLDEGAETRRKQREAYRRANRSEQERLDELARRRRRRLRGERVGEEDEEEREAFLTDVTRHWTPEMRQLMLQIVSVKILGMQVSSIVKNPLLSVEEKQRKIGEAEVPRPVFLPPLEGFSTDTVRNALSQTLDDEEKDLVPVSVPTRPTAVGPASPWPLWPNLQLVKDELVPIYTRLANLRVAFRKAEAEATVERERRGRVDEVVFREHPFPWQRRAVRKTVAVYKATKPDPVQFDKTLHRTALTAAQVARERGRLALATQRAATDPATRERAAAEAQSFLRIARQARRQIHTKNFQQPVQEDRR